MTKLKRSTILLICLAAATVLLNAAAWLSSGFCDWYVENIFPLWVNTYSRLTSLLPFSLGEILIIMGLLLLAAGIISFAVLMVIKKGHRKKIAVLYGKRAAWLVVCIALIQTLNCFILYHCTGFGERYGIRAEEHSFEELVALGDRITAIANDCADKVKRDENGRFVLTADLDNDAKQAMQSLGETYPQLKGFYPRPKPVINSFFMSQQYLMGIYFPFTLEANYNREMYSSNMPETVCHELVHLKGFIQEDEANFISYLACINSGNNDYIYSGSVAALKYIRNKISEYGSEDDLAEFYSKLHPGIIIDWNENNSYWQQVQEDESALIPSQVVNSVSDAATEASLKLNGVSDGMRSYGRMVDLLLDYYSDKD